MRLLLFDAIAANYYLFGFQYICECVNSNQVFLLVIKYKLMESDTRIHVVTDNTTRLINDVVRVGSLPD